MTIAAQKYRVWVHDRRTVMYIVDADSAEEAREKVENSEDADEDFGGTTKDSEWYVDFIDVL